MQGKDAGITFTNIIRFIVKKDIPINKKVTYSNWTFDYRPLKSKPNRCRLIISGDKLDYEEDTSSPEESLL